LKRIKRINRIYHNIHKSAKNSIFVYPLLLSIISALIFYIFFTVTPRQHDKKRIKPQIEFLTDGILMDGLFIVTEMTHKNISQTKYYERTLTVEELSNALKGCFYDSNLKYSNMNKDGEETDIGDFITYHISDINNNIEKLYRYIIFIDPELVSILDELQRNIVFRTWERVNYMRKITKNNKKLLAKRDLSSKSKEIFEFYKTIEKLETYMSLNYYSKLKNYRIKARRAYFRFHDYPQSIKYNKKILRINKSDKDALFYLGASYIENSQVDKGVEYLKKVLKIDPNFKTFIESNIKDKNALKKVFKDKD